MIFQRPFKKLLINTAFSLSKHSSESVGNPACVGNPAEKLARATYKWVAGGQSACGEAVSKVTTSRGAQHFALLDMIAGSWPWQPLGVESSRFPMSPLQAVAIQYTESRV